MKEVEVVVLEDRIDFKYKKPARELSGLYQIKVSNIQGEDVRDVHINFQGKTKTPRTPKLNEKYSEFKINLVIL